MNSNSAKADSVAAASFVITKKDAPAVSRTYGFWDCKRDARVADKVKAVPLASCGNSFEE